MRQLLARISHRASVKTLLGIIGQQRPLLYILVPEYRCANLLP